MCKRILDWFRCKKKIETKQEETKVTEPQVTEINVPEQKVMNAEAVRKYGSSWIPHNADCFIKSNLVAEMFGVSRRELNTKISPNMQHVWINEYNMCSDSPSFGLELGLNMKNIEILASALGIHDFQNLVALRNTYNFALRSAGFVM